MEFNAETVSIYINVVLLPLIGVLLAKVRKYSPQILAYANQLAYLRKKTKTVLNILGSIIAIAATVDKSLADDGELDPEEAKAVIIQIKNLAGSPEVRALMEELSD